MNDRLPTWLCVLGSSCRASALATRVVRLIRFGLDVHSSRGAIALCILALSAVGVTGCSDAPQTTPPTNAPWLDVTKQIELLKTSSGQVQLLAVDNLRRMGARAEEAIPELEKLEDDSDPKLRDAVHNALKEIRRATVDNES